MHKTLKMYVGGAFIRSESGVVRQIQGQTGPVNACVASRKDLRNAMEKARSAQGGWARRSAYNRGQILYRLGEMIEGRGDTLPTTAEDWQRAADRAVQKAVEQVTRGLRVYVAVDISGSMSGSIDKALPISKDGNGFLRRLLVTARMTTRGSLSMAWCV